MSTAELAAGCFMPAPAFTVMRPLSGVCAVPAAGAAGARCWFRLENIAPRTGISPASRETPGEKRVKLILIKPNIGRQEHSL